MTIGELIDDLMKDQKNIANGEWRKITLYAKSEKNFQQVKVEDMEGKTVYFVPLQGVERSREWPYKL